VLCDKLSRLFAPELSIPAKDVKMCLVAHLQKQVSDTLIALALIPARFTTAP
jgi:hypothetical protein